VSNKIVEVTPKIASSAHDAWLTSARAIKQHLIKVQGKTMLWRNLFNHVHQKISWDKQAPHKLVGSPLRSHRFIAKPA
jgi:hypothetical protein